MQGNIQQTINPQIVLGEEGAPVRAVCLFRPASLWSVHKYAPLAALYFFFNFAGVHNGLCYTTLLSPILYITLLFSKRRWILLTFFAILMPFFIAHALNGISSPRDYLLSAGQLCAVYISSYALCFSLTRVADLSRLFVNLIVFNFLATLVALLLFPTPAKYLLWAYDPNSVKGSDILRLNLLSLEPSAYALLMLPLLIYSVLRLLRQTSFLNTLLLLMISIPLLLSQSFGGISMAVAGIGSSILLTDKSILRRPSTFLAITSAALILLAILATNNTISARVFQVTNGVDSSTSTRTTYAFIRAYAEASERSLWWGAGPGQIKNSTEAFDLSGITRDTIPNSSALTLADFGIIGLLLRFLVEFYLFYRTKVYNNTFRTSMFVVVFIAQLTGSYMTNIQEYIMWFLAFGNIFPDMNINNEQAH